MPVAESVTRMRVWSAALILLCGVLLRLASLSVMSTMLNWDEAWDATDALSLLNHPRLTPYYDGRSLLDVWTNASRSPYYRPATLTLWKAMFMLFGRGQPAIFHWINLLAHGTNGLLAGWIAGQEPSSNSAGCQSARATAVRFLFTSLIARATCSGWRTARPSLLLKRRSMSAVRCVIIRRQLRTPPA